MTKDVICKRGKCDYTEKEFDITSDCVDCNIVEQIEHDLLRETLTR